MEREPLQKALNLIRSKTSRQDLYPPGVWETGI